MILNVLNIESHMHIANRYALKKIAIRAENLILQSLPFQTEEVLPQTSRMNKQVTANLSRALLKVNLMFVSA
jgi:hypothetical protein